MQRVLTWIADGFGLGRSPIASGTVGSLPGPALVAAMALIPGPHQLLWQCAVAAVLTVIAVPLCDVAENVYGRKDDGRVVADEYLTFPICMLGIPWLLHPWLLAVGFVVMRLMDIVKPPPARRSQALTGGLGIVVDDLIAALYALAINHIIVATVL